MFGYGFDMFGMIGRWWKDFNQSPSMYEIGRYFLQHKFVVRRCKHKRGKR